MRYTTLLAALLGGRCALSKAVFAHYMVGDMDKCNQDDWEIDIQLAMDAGIDAFALNIAAMDTNNYASLVNGWAAAKAKGFKMFFSFDYAAWGTWQAGDVTDWLKNHTNLEEYYTYNGKPFVSTFLGLGSAGDWSTIKAATNAFFCPDWTSGDPTGWAKQYNDTLDCAFAWQAWPLGPNRMNTSADDIYTQLFANKTYMMAVSPYFFTNLPGWTKNWVWAGDHLWYDRWEEVKAVDPEFIEIVTWNDWGESHYIGPLNNKEYGLFGYGKAPMNYVDQMPHDGWRDFLPYYIERYKTGKAPAVTTEFVVGHYRLTSGNATTACATGGTAGGATWEQSWKPEEGLTDNVFFTALLSSEADVGVTIGGKTVQAQWLNKPDGGEGPYHGSAPFDGNTGAVVISITRNGAPVAQMNGASITTTCVNNTINWNVWVGSSLGTTSNGTANGIVKSQMTINGSVPSGNSTTGSGSGSGSGTFQNSTTTAAASNSTVTSTAAGSGSGNGMTSWKTTSTGAASSSAGSSSGKTGPSSGATSGATSGQASTTAQTSKTATGSASTSTSTSSSSGTCGGGTLADGVSGNYVGLCNFGCAYGVCPTNVCKCTVTASPGTPPSGSGNGCPIDGEDDTYKELCQFACSHGYCPPTACKPC